MHAALQGRNLEQLDDRAAHCRAAGYIARHCSVGEAAMASIGKELRDMFGPGDAQWHDLASDRRGIACAKRSASDAEFEDCCRE
jgi:hypothetical protein